MQKMNAVGIENSFISEITQHVLKYGAILSQQPEKTVRVPALCFIRLKLARQRSTSMRRQGGKPASSCGLSLIDDFDLLIGCTAAII
ncbi:MAG: hypothetical protein H6559_34910 [Lewinellaceae bacterium]|nr:hypothetical protein [Lewinellaceae bacterium]